MSNDALISKIKKALLVLQISNFTAGFAFFLGDFLQGDLLFIIAGTCMMIAVNRFAGLEEEDICQIGTVMYSFLTLRIQS